MKQVECSLWNQQTKRSCPTICRLTRIKRKEEQNGIDDVPNASERSKEGPRVKGNGPKQRASPKHTATSPLANHNGDHPVVVHSLTMELEHRRCNTLIPNEGSQTGPPVFPSQL
uniref:Uncharacterized protein n=1 Tax=Vespula pensylvanica TaxID=30213 RepID=A0A834U7D5_VESPE|nr:hypothetical protein H0235_010077 [Vespula pensylvanica]